MSSGTATFDSLPENLILEILGYLSVKDLCQSGRVCRRWRRIVRDNKLWRHVDLLPYRLNLQRTWKVIRAHFSSCLLSIKIKGFVASETKWRKPSLSDPMLNDLRERCPNIKELHLYFCNTDTITANKLPSCLTTLVMHHCAWQPRWLKSADSHFLPALTHLDLSCSSRVDSHDVDDIIKWSGLKSLLINACYRVNENGLEKIARNLTELSRLEISDTHCTELAVHHIARHLKKLRHIGLSYCGGITDSSLATLADGLTRLESIDVFECKQVTVKGIKCLKVCKSLNHIICGFEDTHIIDEIEREFPNCTVTNKSD